MRRAVVVLVLVLAWCRGASAQTVDTEWTTSDISTLLARVDSVLTELQYQRTTYWHLMPDIHNEGGRSRAVLMAELQGASTTYQHWNGSSYSTVTVNPSGSGMLRTLASSSERTAISDGTKFSVWRELDEIRQGIAGFAGTDNDLLQQIRDALYDGHDQELLELIYGVNTEMAGDLSSISGFTGAMYGDLHSWMGSYGERTWAYMSSLAKEWMENPTTTQMNDNAPTVSWNNDTPNPALGKVEGSISEIKDAMDGADLPGPLGVPSAGVYSESPPVFAFSVPLSGLNAAFGGSLADCVLTVDCGLLPSSVFVLIRAVVICLATLGGMRMVWEELRRYG